MNMHHLLLMGMPNAGELVITLLIIVVLFGGKKIPELAKGLGQGIREFNEAKDGVKEEIEKGMSTATTNKAITQHAEPGVKRDQVTS